MWWVIIDAAFKLTTFAGAGGFADEEGVNAEVIDWSVEDLFCCPSVSDGLLGKFEILEESVAAH